MYAELSQKKCFKCKKTKSLMEFHKNGYQRKKEKHKGTSGLRNDCKECSTAIHRVYFNENTDEINARRRAAYHEDKTKAIAWNLKRYYGITLEFYNQMMRNQNNKCAVCEISQGDSDRRFSVDHCHTTGRIRGLLCTNCNRGLGLLKDDPKLIESAIRYLEG